ncbi:hypothetical protein BAE46_13215 [Glaciecola punicea]|jgi:hypothetical protein|uniref:hypothetical protein n=1 Tax=Glaciecola punicea TaxID=56804 RepID=UPI0008721AB9|nr:hypothetical protein [Glaciecola punicea]OFA29842.1 hypothetical protein BAE46_13215 [Glaciecola punicea]
MITVLLVAHIAVLGYWLGSEFVINHTFRYVSWSAGMPFDERSRLMSHVMNVDQHVRYALVLQLGLGFALAALYGFIPGGEASAWAFLLFMLAWLGFVEVIHHLRTGPISNTLALIDRSSRYLLIIILAGIGIYSLLKSSSIPHWLSWKLICFAGVISSGVGIRIALIQYFTIWKRIEKEGSTASNERAIKSAYKKATSVLLVLWVFIALIVYLSVWKPI